jgi:hypothetical protein
MWFSTASLAKHYRFSIDWKFGILITFHWIFRHSINSSNIVRNFHNSKSKGNFPHIRFDLKYKRGSYWHAWKYCYLSDYWKWANKIKYHISAEKKFFKEINGNMFVLCKFLYIFYLWNRTKTQSNESKINNRFPKNLDLNKEKQNLIMFWQIDP